MMKKSISLVAIVSILCISFGYAQEDITNLGAVVAQYTDSPAGEAIKNITDNQPRTKFLTFHNAAWIQFKFEMPFTVTGYAIISANDAPERDPFSWTFSGSHDGKNWVLLNSQTQQDFPDRFQRKDFTFVNKMAYTYFRLNMINNQGGILQLGEVEIFGTPGNADVVTVYAGSNFSGASYALPVGRYTIDQLKTRGIGNDGFASLRVADGFQVTLFNESTFSGASVVKTGDAVVEEKWKKSSSLIVGPYLGPVPPAVWKEHWFEHNQVVTPVYYDRDLVVYFDRDVDQSIHWMNEYVGNAWRYTKEVYGNMNGGEQEQRLWAVFHHNKYSGGHPAYYYDKSHDYRNVIDLGQKNTWSDSSGWNLDATIHEIGHIVESVNNNMQGSPAFKLWGDSQWCVIYQYDVYVGAGWLTEANRWFQQQINATASYPRANTYWFRDWFYPIWKNYGKSAVLAKFFKLTAQHFPKEKKKYARDMNWGEFVHFWSAATGVNLKGKATNAFGWNAEYEAQFTKAQKDFPLAYHDMFERDGYSLTIINQDPAFDTKLKERMVETFYTVYPKLVNDFNAKATRELTFVIDTAYTGVAEAANGTVRFASRWFHQHPEDIDVVTHEVMHIVQDYNWQSGPGWLTEGIADYVRFAYGVDNKGGKWALPDYKPEHHFTKSYRITARFLVWLEKHFKPGIVKTLDDAMRNGMYSPALWVNQTGKTVDQLWASYVHNPTL